MQLTVEQATAAITAHLGLTAELALDIQVIPRTRVDPDADENTWLVGRSHWFEFDYWPVYVDPETREVRILYGLEDLPQELTRILASR